MNSNTLKFLGAAVLLGTWGAFAFFGKTPVDGFIAAIGAALSGLGVYHVSTASGQPASATAALGEYVPAPTKTTFNVSGSASAAPGAPEVPANAQQ